MSCILIGIVGFALVLAALRPVATLEHELVPIRVDCQPQR
jgi:hypothetical protein